MDPKSHGQMVILSLKCINLKAGDIKTDGFRFKMNEI
jgi:hypothetical protein